MTSPRLALLSILAVSFALLVDEIMLSAIFHVLVGAGNTVAAIAVALVGLSAGGILAYSVPALRRLGAREALSGRLLGWFALVLLASVYALMAAPIHHGDVSFHGGEPRVRLWLLAIYQITVAPFVLGGIVIAVLFRSDPQRIGRLYFSDLLGAALGCVLSPWLLTTLGAPAAVLAGAVPVALLGSRAAWRPGGRGRVLAALPWVLLAAGLVRPELLSFSRISTMGEVAAPAYRSLAIGAGDIEYERWSLDAWTIIRGPGIPQQWEDFRGWGLSPYYEGPIPETKLVNYNARFSTYVTRRDGDPRHLAAWLDADLTSLHHRIGRRYRRVLNIGAGGGREVLAALHHGAERVVAVDVSEVVIEDLMKGELREFSGALYLDPRVEAIADEGRSYAERSRERFDLVEFSIVGGANLEKMDLVRVDDLFTQEALRTYLRRLDRDGVFSYVMYSTRSDIVSQLAREDSAARPYIPALRTFSGLRAALEEAEPRARFSDQVLVAALPRVINPRYDLVHIVASRQPFSETERRSFLEVCERLGFLALHPVPAVPANLYSQIASTPDLEALRAELPFSIAPPTDDRPFQYPLEPGQVRRALARGDVGAVLSGNPLVSMGLSIGGLAVLLTLLPLALTARRPEGLRSFRSHGVMLLYFAGIGFAYMGVEIAALLRLQSYLGKPIHGLSVGLFTFLLSSGLGSAFTGRFRERRLMAAVVLIVAAIVVAGFLFQRLSPGIFASTIAEPLPVRVCIAVASIAPLAWFMGMLFPMGVRILGAGMAELVPWAWATNGCFSVLGIFSTRITALMFGFSTAFLLGLGAYLLVVVFAWMHTRRHPPDGRR